MHYAQIWISLQRLNLRISIQTKTCVNPFLCSSLNVTARQKEDAGVILKSKDFLVKYILTRDTSSNNQLLMIQNRMVRFHSSPRRSSKANISYRSPRTTTTTISSATRSFTLETTVSTSGNPKRSSDILRLNQTQHG